MRTTHAPFEDGGRLIMRTPTTRLIMATDDPEGGELLPMSGTMTKLCI